MKVNMVVNHGAKHITRDAASLRQAAQEQRGDLDLGGSRALRDTPAFKGFSMAPVFVCDI